MPSPLYLLDASIYIFQAHFSPYQLASSTDGEDQSAFMGFARFLLRFLQQTRPARIGVAFDESLFCGFRHQIYPEYKANRVLPDENLERQLRACAALCEVLGLAAWGSRVYEADDIIGIVSARFRDEHSGTEDAPAVHIVSRDKDLAQLLGRERDSLWDPQKDRRRGREDIVREYGVTPEQIPCFQGLTGDAIDCIPGVPGIGPVAARHLLQRFTNLEELYEGLDQVAALDFRGAARCGERLAEHREQAELSRELARILRRADHGLEPFAEEPLRILSRGSVDEPGLQGLLRQEKVSDHECRRLAAMLAPVLETEGGP